MNKIAMLLICAILGISYTAQATNYIKVINTTNQNLKVGLFKSMLNFTEMTVAAGMSREYETGQEQSCLTKVSINGEDVWSGSKCENYIITITKKSDSFFNDLFSKGTFEIEFASSDVPQPVFNPEDGITMQ